MIYQRAALAFFRVDSGRRLTSIREFVQASRERFRANSKGRAKGDLAPAALFAIKESPSRNVGVENFLKT
jgi:hypothetical protein